MARILPKITQVWEIPDFLFPVLFPGWWIAGFFSFRPIHSSTRWHVMVVFFNVLVYAAAAYGLMGLRAWWNSRRAENGHRGEFP
ncbi:MAG: hypothetical protein ABSF45_30260 [Terriglobia bacterium]